MRRYLACIILLILGSLVQTHAQEEMVRGHTKEENQINLERLKKIKKAMRLDLIAKRKRNNITYLPVTFHLAATTSGNGRIREKVVFDALCTMNDAFAPVNIQFYLNNSRFSYINNDAIYSVTFQSEQGVMQFTRDRNAINIWIVDEIPNLGSVGVTQGFYRPSLDHIVLVKERVDDFALIHELGHFFSLQHTFLGWEDDPYDPSKHGNPVQATAPDGRPSELMDKSNCEESGDLICDTPSDYNFGFLDNECEYDGGARDPNGTLVDPDDANFMTYNDNCDLPEYHFSPEQLEVIAANLFMDQSLGFITPTRGYLRGNNTPPITEEVTAMATALSPQDNSSVLFDQDLTLTWQAPANATHAIIEIDILPTFGFQPQRINVEGNSYVLPASDLANGRRYYWRVLSYNALGTCMDFTDAKSFVASTTTSTSVEIPEVKQLSILPNPTTVGQEVTLLAEVTERFDAQLNLVNLSGALVKQLGDMTFPAGANTIPVSTEGLEPGVYVLVIQSVKGVSTKKIVLI